MLLENAFPCHHQPPLLEKERPSLIKLNLFSQDLTIYAACSRTLRTVDHVGGVLFAKHAVLFYWRFDLANLLQLVTRSLNLKQFHVTKKSLALAWLCRRREKRHPINRGDLHDCSTHLDCSHDGKALNMVFEQRTDFKSVGTFGYRTPD